MKHFLEKMYLKYRTLDSDSNKSEISALPALQLLPVILLMVIRQHSVSLYVGR